MSDPKAPESRPLEALASLHGRTVHARRVRVLASHLAAMVPQGLRILDVGCGDGRLSALVMEARGDLRIEGVEVHRRGESFIPTREFDGRRLPFGEGEFDAVMMVDVLHHAEDPEALFREAVRVAGSSIVLKDHYRAGLAANTTLRFMDWIGNRAHGVPLPYTYFSPDEWSEMYGRLGLTVEDLRSSLSLYPAPFSWVFDRSLHFIALLGRRGPRE